MGYYAGLLDFSRRRNEGMQAWHTWMMTRAIVEKLPKLTPAEIEDGTRLANSFLGDDK